MLVSSLDFPTPSCSVIKRSCPTNTNCSASACSLLTSISTKKSAAKDYPGVAGNFAQSPDHVCFAIKCTFPSGGGHVVGAWLCSNGPIRVEDENRYLTFQCGLWCKVGHKHIRKAEEENFEAKFLFLKRTCVEWILLGFMELLVLLQFRTFLFEERMICEVMSGHWLMECSASPFWKERHQFQTTSLTVSEWLNTQHTSSQHTCGRKTLFQIRWLITQFMISNFPIQFSTYTTCPIHQVFIVKFWAWETCNLQCTFT